MATIIQNKKDGKVVSYKFRAYLGKDAFGKQIMRYTTWSVPSGMHGIRVQKAAEKAAAIWENEVKGEYQKDLCDPGRIKLREQSEARTSFEDTLNSWIQFSVCNGDHKPTTTEFYRHIAMKISEYFEGQCIQQISSIDIQKYIIYLRTEYRTKQDTPLSDKTIRHHYYVLTMIFDYALDHEIILKNPMDKVELPKLGKKQIDAFSKEQAQRFFDALDSCPLDFRCMLVLLITTGLRRGELLGLQWRDLDFCNLTISVQRNVTYTPESGIRVDTPKTLNSMRRIPMIPFLAEMLRKYRDQRRWSAESFLFTNDCEANTPRDPSSVTRRVKRFMKNNGLPDMSPHDLRHSCATLLLQNGADIKSIQAILGHASASTTLNFYVKADAEQMKEAANKFAAAFKL